MALAELRAHHLVETDWLATQRERDLRVVDMRGYVRTRSLDNGVQTADYEGASEEYTLGHIPGAVYLDWTRDIVDENDPVPAQVAPPDKVAAVLGQAGIGNHSLVIAYDNHPASQFATRLWWVLRYYGHDNVRVLNGGWKKWVQEGRHVTTEIPHYPAATFTPQIRPEWNAAAEQVLESLGSPVVTLIDARDEGQYTGRIRRGKRGGHIPGAKHLPREAFFTEEGVFQTPETLQKIVAASGVTPQTRTVAYCNGGVAATSVLFALSMLGYPHLTNYDGSWNEWNEREELPVE